MARYCSECGGSLSGTRKGQARRTARRAYEPKKRKGKKNPALSRAMKKAYSHAHKKNGDFRKGWDRSRMLKYAHKIK